MLLPQSPRHLCSKLKEVSCCLATCTVTSKRFPGGAAVLSPQLPRHLCDKLKRLPENGGLQPVTRSRARSSLRLRKRFPDYRFAVTLAHPSRRRANPNMRELPEAFPRRPMLAMLKR